MNRVSRRTFLRQASLGAAAVGVASTVPSFLRQGSKSSVKAGTAALPMGRVAQDGPLVADIDDVNSGQITVMFGTRQVSYHSDEIARQLLSATQ